MIIDACHLLSLAGFPLRDYQYTGFGSIYFVDFILFHKLLGIAQMLSVEKDKEIAKRVRYNRPFAFIKLVTGTASEIIPTLSPDRKHILWLDYDSVLSADHIEDIRLAGTYLPAGSIILVTVDAEPPGDCKDGPSEWKKHFYTEAGELAFSFDTVADFAESKLVSVNVQLLERAIRAGLSGREADFTPLFNFVYADGHKMLTVGGMITTETERERIRGSKLPKAPYARTDFRKKPFEIRVPRVTRKERLHIDAAMPCSRKWKPKFEMRESDIESYRQIFPFLPAYAELLL